MAPKKTIATKTRVSEYYNFMEEDPDVYSDLEEPWKHEGHEEFPTDKNTKGPGGAVRTVVKEVEKEVVKVVEVEVPGNQGGEQQEALSEIATLVQKQKSTLAKVGVALPSTSGKKGHKVTGAVPKKRYPKLKPKVLDCPVCGKVFQQHSKLVKHYVSHTRVSEYSCETCGQSFSNQTGLSNHERLHSSYKCHIAHVCPGVFDSKKALAAHLKTVTEYVDMDDNVKCPLCLRAFTTRDSMLKHKKHRCFHNPNVQIEYFFCKFCNHRYRERKYLNQHQANCKANKGKPRQGRKGGKGGKGGKKT